MTDTVGRPGLLTFTRCVSHCQACEEPGRSPVRCLSIAGPDGYVTMCFDCAARWLLQATLDEKGTGIRAFSVML